MIRGSKYLILFLMLTVCICGSAQISDQTLGQAKDGNPEAQYLLADSYTTAPRYNRALAIEWFRKAALQGNIKSQVRLVHLLSSGAVSQASIKEAFAWAQKAAAKDDTDGIYWLGYCYGSGVGVNQNPAKALEYFRIAASRGNPKYQYDLAQDLMYGVEVLPNPSEAYKWYKLAADQKHPNAMVMTAVCMLSGKVTEINVEGAIQLFDQAVSLGSDIAKSYQPAFDSARKKAKTK